MKKIAIIAYQEHFRFGGVPQFQTDLIKVFKRNNIPFVEYFCGNKRFRGKRRSENIHDNIFDIHSKFDDTPLNTIKNIHKLIDNDEIGLIIMSTPKFFNSRKISGSKKIIKVQHRQFHEDYDVSSNILDWMRTSMNILFGAGLHGNTLENSETAVYFDKSTDHSNSNQIKYFSTLSTSVKISNDSNVHKGGIWFGRFEIHNKGLDKLYKIWHEEKFSIYGIGSKRETKWVSDHFGSSYKGFFDKTKNRVDLDNKRYSLLSSRTEGFPFMMVESLSRGVPVIVYDSFDSVDFFKKCDGVFPIKDGDSETFVNTIREIESMNKHEWNTLSDICIQFSKKYFSFESFEKRWLKIIKNTIES